MICAHPYRIGNLRAPCGGRWRDKRSRSWTDCLPCLINRRRIWTGRMLLEAQKSSGSCFVTLTYGTDNLPVNGSLVKADPTNWLKRLRNHLPARSLRYFIVGEYGDKSERPHYHAALFGVSQGIMGGIDGISGLAKETWEKGFTFVGGLTRESASYVAGYVTKKMTRRDDVRLRGREPEFARMSLRPGIGAPAVCDIAKPLATAVGRDFIEESGDVPGTLRHCGKLYPLGRYLRGKIRENLGLDSEVIRIRKEQKAVEEMQRLYKEDVAIAAFEKKEVNQYRLDRLRQELLNCTKRFEIYSHPERRYL